MRGSCSGAPRGKRLQCDTGGEEMTMYPFGLALLMFICLLVLLGVILVDIFKFFARCPRCLVN